MFRYAALIVTLAILPFCGSDARAATMQQLVQREGWRGLLCWNAVPDCICKYCCPDYCKKPLPKVCGPLPPNLSCGPPCQHCRTGSSCQHCMSSKQTKLWTEDGGPTRSTERGGFARGEGSSSGYGRHIRER
jgi:hypothetical protein